ncbi:MAG: type II secretion system F family protein [Prosthecobacter sp.]|uniref:type II secretion system F family protein n=1 Tax=Prosthecobacter sp. TaxID=1965333 RepID=UPI002607722C|nr:type II secretion system F family protein [Prosthecobacter sp.]MCF7790205.1 type II secretion system F family protein [Prosthecobacter sp.]
MMLFAFQALSADGTTKSGTLEAADRGDALRQLARRGLQARSIQSQTAEIAKSDTANSDTVLTLSKTDVIRFTEDMGDLLASGLQVEQALQAMENRSASKIGTLATRVRALVRDGVPLSAALRQASPAFDELYCNMVAAGENSGALDDIMDRQARHLRLMESVQAKVVGALIYPAFLISAGGALALVMVTYLLPKLASLLTGSGKEPPFMIKVSLALSDLLKNYWWALGIALGCIIMLLFALRKTPGFQSGWHRFMIKMPGIRDITRARFELQFFETLGSLLRGGVPLIHALELVRRAVTNLHLKHALGQAEALVQEGASLSHAMKKTKALDSQAIDVIRIGEDTGHLAEVLGKAAARMDTQLTRTIERVTALIQPCLLLIMAALVGTLVYTMVNIVFSTLSQLRH